MKNTLLTIIAAAATALAANAEVSDLQLGYCSGQLPKKGNLSYSSSDDHVSAAIYIPQGTLSTFSGNSIVGVNAGLASKLNVDELTVWVRSSLDGENLAQNTITTSTDPSIVKGWNTLKFDESWEIPANPESGVYIGYTYHQKGSAFGVAAIDTPCPNSFFVKFGDDAEWENRSSEGTLSIEGLVQGEKLPKINLALANINVPEIYIIDKGTVNVTGTVKNLATWTVTGFNVSAEVDGVRVATVEVCDEIPYNCVGEFDVTLPLGITEIGEGYGEVTITVDGLAEGEDEDMTDNSLTAGFSIVQHDFTHRIFVEEFTTEQCPNCPRVGNYIHESLEKDIFAEDVLVVCHHSGYYTDWLTASFDNQYTWLFNANGSTYAPAMTVDRTPIDKDTTPVFSVSSKDQMENVWKNRLAAPALVSLDITGIYDDENPLAITVRVNGSKSIDELCDNPTITVFVVENNVAARNQAGATGSWIHQHVGRLVNSVWGEPVEFDGDDYRYECSFKLNQTWDLDNIQIIAMIANYNPNNANDCQVKNAASLDHSKFVSSSAVRSIEDLKDAAAEIYTLSGQKVASAAALAPGVYIRKTASGTEKFIAR